MRLRLGEPAIASSSLNLPSGRRKHFSKDDIKEMLIDGLKKKETQKPEGPSLLRFRRSAFSWFCMVGPILDVGTLSLTSTPMHVPVTTHC